MLVYETEENYWIENREFIGIKSLCSICDHIWSLSVEDLRAFLCSLICELGPKGITTKHNKCERMLFMYSKI